MNGGTILLAHASSELYGSDRVFLESVHAAIATGRPVVVTLPQDGPLVAEVGKAGAEVTFCPTPILRKAALRPAGLLRLVVDAVRALGPMIRLLRRTRPETVYVNTVTVPLWFPLARLAGAQVLAHVHEAEDAVPRPIRFALAVPLLAAHTVVVNSRATGAVLGAALPRLRARTELVYNGVPGPEKVTEHREAAEPLRILLVGRVSPRKGTDVAVDALAALRRDGVKAELEIVGSIFPGYEWFEADVRAAIEAGGLADSVRFAGFHDDVWGAYERADIALVPSRVEPFGNTAVEAQLAGVPVIVSDAQGLPETVDGGRRGTIVPAGDAAALADAIRNLAGDWPAARLRAELARDEAEGKFSVERYRQEIAGLLSTTAKQVT
ncbi:MAG: cps2I [Amycolatopsis sp.]|jgi:glycosyltransferase involved in cell wall biosynthesis|uniref:glycosyltransferase n=1 Tax=Amycolatopsis sp. TaxID=37632 RepID=UPI002637A129|nr:glycosyltransferase [Amycolatopsis sp.]MCU1682745.1 cps2I [Amycolatopsis sp.]